MQAEAKPSAKFHHMKEGTAEDWAIIGSEAANHAKGLPARLLEHLSLLAGDCGGFPVDRLTHCLQTAPSPTRTVKTKNTWSAPCSMT